MIGGLDSSFDAPTTLQADTAAAAGLRLWSGYIALPGGGIGLAAPWSQASFDAARRCGSTPLGFCSGWDDPVQLAAQASAWNVRLCLDVEQNIRDLGTWTQAWLDASGAGLYGRAAVHGLRAAFHVLAAYPGFDPQASWPRSGTRPADGAPCGWQWQGSHEEFGCQVDRGTYDDWFGGNMAGALTDQQDQALARVLTLLVDGEPSLTYDGQQPQPDSWPKWLATTLNQIAADTAAIRQQTPAPVDVAALAAAIVAKLPPAAITKDDVQAACAAAIAAAGARLAAPA